MLKESNKILSEFCFIMNSVKLKIEYVLSSILERKPVCNDMLNVTLSETGVLLTMFISVVFIDDPSAGGFLISDSSTNNSYKYPHS